MKRYSRLAAMSTFIVLAAVHSVQSRELSLLVKRNLDLPQNGGLRAKDRIRFYGTELEVDGIFYVIDRSGSMQNSGELQIAKREVVQNITELSTEVEIGIVFFDAGVMKFPAGGRPAKATSPVKASAVSFVESTPGGSGSCCQQGLATGLQFANLSIAERKVLVYVGDGGGTCQGANEQTYLDQTLSVVKTLNFLMTRINTIGVLEIGTVQDDFLRSLSHSNYGTYWKISR